jgi:hypothetical protein
VLCSWRATKWCDECHHRHILYTLLLARVRSLAFQCVRT